MNPSNGTQLRIQIPELCFVKFVPQELKLNRGDNNFIKKEKKR